MLTHRTHAPTCTHSPPTCQVWIPWSFNTGPHLILVDVSLGLPEPPRTLPHLSLTLRAPASSCRALLDAPHLEGERVPRTAQVVGGLEHQRAGQPQLMPSWSLQACGVLSGKHTQEGASSPITPESDSHCQAACTPWASSYLGCGPCITAGFRGHFKPVSAPPPLSAAPLHPHPRVGWQGTHGSGASMPTWPPALQGVIWGCARRLFSAP